MKKRLSARRAATFLATLGVLVMSSGVALMVAATPAEAAKVHKSYVCKYVGTPEDNELSQTGQNPIWVDNSALGIDGLAAVGDTFNDAQGFSVVVIANTLKLKPEPGVEICEGTPPPGLDLATASASFTDPTCEAPESGSIATSVDSATLTIVPEKASYAVGDAVEITAAPVEGAAFEEGAQTSWSHTFVLADGPCARVDVPEDDPVVDVSPPTTKTPTTTPTVVSAGLTDVAKDMRGEQGLALVFAGMLLLLGAGGLGLRVRGGAAQV